MNLGVYCETLSPEALAEPDVLNMLGFFGVTLGHAVRFTEEDGGFDPDQVQPYLELGHRLKEAGGRCCLWPLLPKSMGYWINERNLDGVDRMADALLEGCRRFGGSPDLIVADVETPWRQMEKVFFPGPSATRRLLSYVEMFFSNRRPARFAQAAGRLTEIVERLRAGAAPVSAAVFPFLIMDLVNQGHMLQDTLEMPIFPVPFDAYNAMFYNSYIPATAPRLVPPAGAARALYEYGAELVGRFGEKAWVTLGSTWEGVLPGNEDKVYRRAEELVPDIEAAKAAGVRTMWLYCLEGVLYTDQKLTQRRSIREGLAFFEAMADTPARVPPENRAWTRSRALMERATRDRLKWAYRWPGGSP